MRPRTALVSLAVVASFAAFFALVAVLGNGSVVALSALGAAVTTIASVVASARSRVGGELLLDADGVTVSGPMWREIPRRAVEDGFEVPNGVVLHLKSGATFEAEFDGTFGGQVLEHLGFSLDQRALDLPLRGALGGFSRGLLTLMSIWLGAAFIFAQLRIHSFALVGLLTAVAASVAVVRWLRPRVVVGIDGLRVVGVLRPRFVSYKEITSLRERWGTMTGCVLIVASASGTLLLPVMGQSPDQITALRRRIDEGRARGQKAGGARSIHELDRNGRPLAQWRKALKMIGASSGGFRDIALSTSDLHDVLADANAPLDRRVGAALALREVDDGRTRVRQVAVTAADPRLRAVLEDAAADEVDDGALERRLGR
jgi:hypothetical protein